MLEVSPCTYVSLTDTNSYEARQRLLHYDYWNSLRFKRLMEWPPKEQHKEYTSMFCKGVEGVRVYMCMCVCLKRTDSKELQQEPLSGSVS